MKGLTLLAISAALVLGCGGKKKDGGEGSGTATTPGSGSAKPDPGSNAAGSGSGSGSDTAMAGSGSGSGSAAAGSGSDTMAGSGSGAEVRMQHQAGNCPSTVLGATTKAELKGKDVVLTITATDADAIAAIQKRTVELLKEKADGATSGKEHDQKGTHGGGMGLCPVYWTEGGKATQKKDAKGVTITITPKDKPEELKAAIDDRIKKAEDFVKKIPPGDKGNQGGVGGGKGEHGSTHAGSGDGKGQERKGGDGKGGGSGGGGGKGTGGGKGGGGKKEGGW